MSRVALQMGWQEAHKTRASYGCMLVLFGGTSNVLRNGGSTICARWVRAWNSHDLDAVMAHYAREVVLISPTAAKLLGDAFGTVTGNEAVRGYFARGLEAYPNLTFELLDVMWGLSSIVLYYVNQQGTKTGEFMEFDANQKIVRVVANYN